MSDHEASPPRSEAAAAECPSSDSGSCSKGIYMMDQQLVAITRHRGKLLQRMGIQRGNALSLRLEEAMYLVERNLLAVEVPSAMDTAAASTTELKRLMEGAGIAPQDYAVYKELMNASLIVTRHPAQWLGSKIDQAGVAGDTACDSGNEKELSSSNKRQKPDPAGAAAGSTPAEGGSEQQKQKHQRPTTDSMPQSSRDPEHSVQGPEAPSSSIGEWRLPDRPHLQPLKRCPPPSDRSTSLHQPTLVYDVYRGNERFSRKKPSGLLMQVHMSQSCPPSRDSMCAAEAACQGDEAVYHATAAGSQASIYSFQPVCLPDLLGTSSPQQQHQAPAGEDAI